MSPRDQQTEDYATRARDGDEPLCASLSIEGAGPHLLRLPTHGRLTFGRGHQADVRLVVRSVSRMHVALAVSGGGHTIDVSDLGSRNGTLVDGEPLTESPKRVARGSEIAFGAVRMVLVPEAAVPAGAHPLCHQAALLARLDRGLAEGHGMRVVVLRLRTYWHDCTTLSALFSALPPEAQLGIVDERTLVVVLPESVAFAPTWAAQSGEAGARATELEAVASMHGSAPARGGGGAALLASALRALVPGAVGKRAPRTPASDAPTPLDSEAERVARSALSVLIVGETGVGKEVMAQRIHTLSGRTGPLISVNAAALPEALIESELFGYERGAFSGAQRDKTGLFEAAQHGTLFLDEIGDLPLALQAKLLRVLEDKKVRPLGATSERQIDVRVIAATHRDLEEQVRAGKFREDLYFRLNASTLRIPPLRERRDELDALTRSLLARLAAEQGRREIPALTVAAQQALVAHPFPGNVRELKNVLERALALLDPGAAIDLVHLPTSWSARPVERTQPRASEPRASEPLASEPPSTSADVRAALKDYERARIVATLDEVDGNVARAARLLGLPRRTLAYRIARLGIRTE